MLNMNEINRLIRDNYYHYCQKWDLSLPEKLLLKHYTEEVIAKSIFKEE